MIIIDYQIERDEGNETVIYKPKLLPKQFENVVYIKGPNSSGKSTYLNLIALAFWGNKLTELDRTLKNKLDNLLDLEHQKLTFDISVDNPQMGIRLISQKNNPLNLDVSVKMVSNGLEIPISADSFFREFRLIYDIPSNPLDRLQELLNDLKVSQSEIGIKIGELKETVRFLIEEITNSRDPEKLLEITKKCEEYENYINEFNEEISIIQQYRDKLRKYYLYRSYYQYQNESIEKASLLDKLKNDLQKAKKQGITDTKIQTNLEKRIQTTKQDIIESKHKVISILEKYVTKDNYEHFRAFKNASLDNEIYHSDIYQTLRKKSKHFLDILQDLLKNEENVRHRDLDAIDVYRKLLATLSEILFNKVTLPGVDQTVEIFKKNISDELKQYEAFEQTLQDIKECINQIDNFNLLLNTCIQLVNEYKNISKSVPEPDVKGIYEIQKEIQLVMKQITELDKKIEKIRAQLIRYHLDPAMPPTLIYNSNQDIDIAPFINQSESSIESEISKMDAQLLSKTKKRERFSELLRTKKEEKIKMKSKDTHIYFNYKVELENFYDVIKNLEQRFKKKFTDNIMSIINNSRLTSDDKVYAGFLGRLLAKKIYSIIYIDKEYLITNVDLIRRIIQTESDKVIKFDDLGTGQSQAAFLQGKLAMNEDKKIIALFDEVAMMDESSLAPVKQKIKRLYEEKKLFMAIIVQKSETVSVEPLL